VVMSSVLRRAGGALDQGQHAPLSLLYHNCYFRDRLLGAADVARVRLAGLLHDVGKIGVPDAILTKQGKLTPEEFAIIQQHPVIGERMLGQAPFLRDILPAVRHHHERWDGQGYPDGLAGAAISRDAAILMVADSFDAMTSSRTYRMALPLREACRRMREGAGTQFDPQIVAAFEQAIAAGDLQVLAAGDLQVLASGTEFSRPGPATPPAQEQPAGRADGMRFVALLARPLNPTGQRSCAGESL